MENQNFRTATEAVQALINDSLGAFIYDSVRLEFEASKNCDLRTRGPLFGRSAYAVALQKDSPWTERISEAILQISEG
jgi:ionotropic glutamate receptor NMDA 1